MFWVNETNKTQVFEQKQLLQLQTTQCWNCSQTQVKLHLVEFWNLHISSYSETIQNLCVVLQTEGQENTSVQDSLEVLMRFLMLNFPFCRYERFNSISLNISFSVQLQGNRMRQGEEGSSSHQHVLWCTGAVCIRKQDATRLGTFVTGKDRGMTKEDSWGLAHPGKTLKGWLKVLEVEDDGEQSDKRQE